MHHETFHTNDGTRLAFQTSYPTSTQSTDLPSTCILLMHGFSGSSEYFVRNYPGLTDSQSWVVAPDMRGHGKSQHTRGGYHVARLAADLKDLVDLLRTAKPDVRIYAVGCSIGAAVLWTFTELFGNRGFRSDGPGLEMGSASQLQSLEKGNADGKGRVFSGMVFVDQAPLQDRTVFGNWDQSRAHYGLYDERTLLDAQSAWSSQLAEVAAGAHRGLVASCLGYRVSMQDTGGGEGGSVSRDQMRADEEFFTKISALCDGTWLARLMADHTRYDHREAIEDIDVPVLVMAGAKSGCFPIKGMLETVERVNMGKERELATASVFPCGHWLFYEEPERFNREILDFVRACEGQRGA